MQKRKVQEHTLSSFLSEVNMKWILNRLLKCVLRVRSWILKINFFRWILSCFHITYKSLALQHLLDFNFHSVRDLFELFYRYFDISDDVSAWSAVGRSNGRCGTSLAVTGKSLPFGCVWLLSRIVGHLALFIWRRLDRRTISPTLLDFHSLKIISSRYPVGTLPG